jgi:hypothetical protein
MKDTARKTFLALKVLAVFAVWTLTSFLSHKLAKMAMARYNTPTATSLMEAIPDMTSSVVAPLMVTVCQILCCAVAMTLTSRHSLSVVVVTSHMLATVATVVSLSMTWATCTLAVKMLEPMTLAMTQRVLLATPLTFPTILSTVLVMVGAACYVIPVPWWSTDVMSGDVVRAATMAMLSNVALGVRNVSIKLSHAHHGNAESQAQSAGLLRPRQPSMRAVVQGLGIAALLVVCVLLFIPPTTSLLQSFLPLLLALSSGVFHVIYNYVSVMVVLRHMSVLSHALLNILKRVLVVLLLQASGQRMASLWNWAGLAVCGLGLLLYQRHKVTAAHGHSQTGSSHSTARLHTHASHGTSLLLVGH